MQNRLGLFAKHWTPGAVKTRLSSIGMDRACNIYHLMLTHLIRQLKGEADLRSVVYTPAEQQAAFEDLVQGHWELTPQSTGDLGQRLRSFFEKQFQRQCVGTEGSFPNVVVMGADCPGINPRIIREAFIRLQKTSVVLGPSRDGGYYLLGMNQPHWELFQGIAWSTDQVWGQTIDCLDRLAVTYEVLPQLGDVDTATDLKQLISEWSPDPLLEPSQRELLRDLVAELAREI